MAGRGWLKSLLTAAAAAAGASAAQLGLGYGLGVIAWLPADEDGRDLWLATLVWVLWLAAVSTVLGAVAAGRVGGHATGGAGNGARLVDGAWRLVVALAAAIGALLAVPLVVIPARAAVQVDNFLPQATAGLYAVVGVVVGLAVAVLALSSRAVAANVVVSAVWGWLLAAVAVLDHAGDGVVAGTAQLGLWDTVVGEQWFRRTVYLPGALVMLLGALLVGFIAAWRAGRRGDGRIGVALSGAAGPLLVAVAYLLASPPLPADTRPTAQFSAYLIAPYAVLAGLAGSVLVAALAGRPPRRAEAAEAAAGPDEWVGRLATAEAAPPGPEPGARGAAERAGPAGRPLEDDAYAPAAAYPPAPPATGSAPVPGVRPLWPEPAGQQSDADRPSEDRTVELGGGSVDDRSGDRPGDGRQRGRQPRT